MNTGVDLRPAKAVRYLAFSPVRAGLGRTPKAWRWSSVAAYLAGRNDALVSVKPVLAAAPRLADLLAGDDPAEVRGARRQWPKKR